MKGGKFRKWGGQQQEETMMDCVEVGVWKSYYHNSILYPKIANLVLGVKQYKLINSKTLDEKNLYKVERCTSGEGGGYWWTGCWVG